MSHSAEYTAYLDSMPWKAKRHQAISAAGYRCQSCGVQRLHGLEVHHLHYDTLGDERLADLRVLCPACHAEADAERAAETADRVWAARLDGWASRKYGDDWAFWRDADAVEEEFEAWLEDHER